MFRPTSQLKPHICQLFNPPASSKLQNELQKIITSLEGPVYIFDFLNVVRKNVGEFKNLTEFSNAIRINIVPHLLHIRKNYPDSTFVMVTKPIPSCALEHFDIWQQAGFLIYYLHKYHSYLGLNKRLIVITTKPRCIGDPCDDNVIHIISYLLRKKKTECFIISNDSYSKKGDISRSFREIGGLIYDISAFFVDIPSSAVIGSDMRDEYQRIQNSNGHPGSLTHHYPFSTWDGIGDMTYYCQEYPTQMKISITGNLKYFIPEWQRFFRDGITVKIKGSGSPKNPKNSGKITKILKRNSLLERWEQFQRKFACQKGLD